MDPRGVLGEGRVSDDSPTAWGGDEILIID